MTDQELADKLAGILLYNELSDKAKSVIDNAYVELSVTRWCDDCKHKDTCERYREEMQSPRASFFQGCMGGYEQDDTRGEKE